MIFFLTDFSQNFQISSSKTIFDTSVVPSSAQNWTHRQKIPYNLENNLGLFQNFFLRFSVYFRNFSCFTTVIFTFFPKISGYFQARVIFEIIRYTILKYLRESCRFQKDFFVHFFETFHVFAHSATFMSETFSECTVSNLSSL